MIALLLSMDKNHKLLLLNSNDFTIKLLFVLLWHWRRNIPANFDRINKADKHLVDLKDVGMTSLLAIYKTLWQLKNRWGKWVGSAQIRHYWFVCVFTRVEDLGGNTVRAWGTKSWAGQGLADAWISQKTFLQKMEI